MAQQSLPASLKMAEGLYETRGEAGRVIIIRKRLVDLPAFKRYGNLMVVVGRTANCISCLNREGKMELTGTVNAGVIVFDYPCEVPDGTKVVVQIDEPGSESSPPRSTLGRRLLKHAGVVSGLPEDLAEQHDHYLHGTPKR